MFHFFTYYLIKCEKKVLQKKIGKCKFAGCDQFGRRQLNISIFVLPIGFLVKFVY